MKYKFDRVSQHFVSLQDGSLPDLPITMTLQVTRACNISCIYCSEDTLLSAPDTKTVMSMIEKMKGVDRVIISGGEPTLRKDIFEILQECRKMFDVVAMASNATRIDFKMAKELKKYLDYIDVTIDGPRNIHNQIRGHFDEVMVGLWNLKQAEVETSIVTVLLNENKDYIPYICHTADLLGAKKLKILSPIPKGRGNSIVDRRISNQELKELFSDIKKHKERMGWSVRVTVTDWDMIQEGHALLIHPNGDVVASPVWTKEGCVSPVGNLIEENLTTIWENFPYKENHIKKYIEKTLMVC